MPKHRTRLALALIAAGGIGAGALGVALPAAAEVEVPGPDAPQASEAGIRISEVESSGGDPGDWIEFVNAGGSPVDLSGYVVKDSEDDHAYAIADGTILMPQSFLVLDELADQGDGHFDFGLGGSDRVRLFDPSGALVDEAVWTAHAPTTLGRTDAGDWAATERPTKGAPNAFPEAPTGLATLRLSEVDSQPADWVELVNTGTAPVDLAGVELRDNSDDHSWGFPAGAAIEAGAYLVVDEHAEGVIGAGTGRFGEAIGIGSADRIRLFDPAGALLDDTGAWSAHAAIGGDAALATLARCEPGIGDFVLAHPTPGAANECATDDGGETPTEPELDLAAWPGGAGATILDPEPLFLEDSSGLDVQETADGAFLWAVDNGEGRFWKLAIGAGGTVSFAEGWEEGKRARFSKDASDPRAAGPDTEGITVAGDGMIYLASERDNGAKGVNFNAVLRVDPEAPGPDVVADREWDLTAQLPQVSANLGIEAVEWVPDAALAGRLVDASTGAGYDPAAYPLHGDGLFFVAVEDGGRVFAFALNSDGTAQQVAELRPGLPGVMALDWDAVRGGLWAVCDDGCGGASAFLTLNGTAEPGVEHFARPAELPDTNNEGFATAPASLAAAAEAGSGATARTVLADETAPAANTRPAWWFTDGVRPGALHVGTLAAAAPAPTPGGGDGGTGGQEPATGGGAGQGSGSGSGAAAAPATAGSLPTTGREPQEFLLLGVALLVFAGASAIAFARTRGAHDDTARLEIPER